MLVYLVNCFFSDKDSANERDAGLLANSRVLPILCKDSVF